MARKNSRPKRAGRKPNHVGRKPSKVDKSQDVPLLNLEEKPASKYQSLSSYKHYKTTTTKTNEPATTTTARPQIKPASDVNVKAIPIGTTLTVLPSGAYATHTGSLPLFPSPTAPITTPVSSLVHDDAVPSGSLETKQRQTQAQPTAKHIPTVVIALVAVGVAFLLLGIFIVFRICRRPRRRSCPTPSLPILQDPFADQDTARDEESLFGGKERACDRPESNVLWTWTQYSQPSLRKPEPTLSGIQEKMDDARTNSEPAKRNSTGFNEKRASGDRSATHTQTPIQPAQTALTRAANRISAMSMSVYPGSPVSRQASQGIGVALGGSSPLTADGMPVLQRSISKASTQRLLKNRRSVRYSLYDLAQSGDTPTGNHNPEVYDGAQVTSPVASTPNALPKSKSAQGRARVKTPYAPGVLRASSSVSAYLGRDSNPFEDTQYILPPLSPALKTDALRERDTRALTSALGLSSPPPPSPQPTLYPDDSITRRQSRAMGHGRGQSENMSPSMEASARLGNLMLAEFTSMASLPSTRMIAGQDQQAPVVRAKSTRKRADDKPPRVPSPPPMPSLAQMALAHTNPQDYADYRSPTYSIYGLYEADRKSRAPGEGGY